MSVRLLLRIDEFSWPFLHGGTFYLLRAELIYKIAYAPLVTSSTKIHHPSMGTKRRKFDLFREISKLNQDSVEISFFLSSFFFLSFFLWGKGREGGHEVLSAEIIKFCWLMGLLGEWVLLLDVTKGVEA